MVYMRAKELVNGDSGCRAHRVPDDHGREGIVVAEVEADLHA